MKKIIFIVLLFIVCFSLANCSNKNDKAYDEACQAVFDDNIELAKQLFNDIPDDYKPSDYSVTPNEWLESIDRYYDSVYIGTWKNGSYSIEISRNASEINGVYLSYYKRYTSPGGVTVSDHGWIRVSTDGNTATYYNSSSSNAKNYELRLIDENTIEVWFDGLKGTTREITLSRVGSK